MVYIKKRKLRDYSSIQKERQHIEFELEFHLAFNILGWFATFAAIYKQTTKHE